MLVLRDKVRIECPPEIVWTLVADPGLWPGWNPRVVAVHNLSTPPGPGSTFAIDSNWRNKSIHLDGCITHWEPNLRITARYTDPARSHTSDYYEETLTLTQRRRHTLVRQTVLIRDSRIPFPITLLVWLIALTGRAQGDGPLQYLRNSALELSSK